MTLEKQLDRIRKFRKKGQFQKARAVVEEALQANGMDPEICSEALSISLETDSWTETLNLCKSTLAKLPFGEVCGGQNREAFLRLVQDYSGFRTLLMDFLLTLPSFDGICGWLALSDEADQQWLIKSWLQAGEDAEDPQKAAGYRTAAGVGLFLHDDWETAWRLWIDALQEEPRLLKRIMTLCQSSGKLDLSQLNHRVKLIKLIAAGGKKNESLSLLLALGMESKKNALKVLIDLHDFNLGDHKNKEVITLRFNLALYLGDSEILGRVLADMTDLSENDLFLLKKQAILKLKNPDLRRSVLLDFVRVYIEKESWENAALQLDSLFDEGAHPDILALMEQVLERYPIMSQLRYTLGVHYLKLGAKDKALAHLGVIQQIQEYRDSIRAVLENHLAGAYDTAFAEMLLNLVNPGSHKAGLLALHLALHEGPNCEKYVKAWRAIPFQGKLGPFWLLALINACSAVKQYDRCGEYLLAFLADYPHLAAEALRPAEYLCTQHQADFTRIAKLIRGKKDRLEPLQAWADLAAQLEANTKAFLERAAEAPSKPKPEPKEETRTQTTEAPAQDLNLKFRKFQRFLTAGDWHAASEVAEETAVKFPEKAASVLAHLEKLDREQQQNQLWLKTALKILVRLERFAEGIELGQKALTNPKFQQDLPEIYQWLARAYDGNGRAAESLRFFCLSSRQSRFYKINREMLVNGVLPNHPHLLKEVLHLVLINEDTASWNSLMKAWFQYRPDDLLHLVKAQSTFSNTIGTPEAFLELAHWYLQAGQLEPINETLDLVDLMDPNLREKLEHLAELSAIKFPENPKPKFMLGRYFLLHGEEAKAVDSFRALSEQIPEAGTDVFRYLREYLKENHETCDKVLLYGLLIRIALQTEPSRAIKLLDELSRLDRGSAETLINGVSRVVMEQKQNLDLMFEFGSLLRNWGMMERLLELYEQVDFGSHLAQERLAWLAEIQAEETLKDRARVAKAEVLFAQREFDECAHTLAQLENPAHRRRALPLYDRLTVRFPDRMDLWRAAGWAAFPGQPDKAANFFEQIYENQKAEWLDRLEAFAVLSELGEKPDLEPLKKGHSDLDTIFKELLEVHARIREIQLTYWQKAGGDPPIRALEWLLANGKFSHYQALRERCDPLDAREEALLDAKYHLAQNQAVQAAWRLSTAEVSLAVRQSFFYNAGLIERAILLKPPGTRLPNFLKQGFYRAQGEPRTILARYAQLKHLQDPENQ